MSYKLKSIYDSFEKYRREDVDLIIAMLSDEDRILMYLRNGENLDCPKRSIDCTSEDVCKYAKYLLYKIRRELLGLKEDRKEQKNIYSIKARNILISKIKDYLIGNEEYLTILWLIRTPALEHYLVSLPFTEAMSIILWLGYYDDHFFTIRDIAHILERTEEEIYQNIRNGLLNYYPELELIIDKLLKEQIANNYSVKKIRTKK